MSFVHKTFATLEPGTPFRPNWHHRAMCYQLGRVARGECRRLIINVPPRSLKSISVSVGFPAWLLGREPGRKVICVSYARELARRHALDFRRVVETPWYRALYPEFGLGALRQRDLEITTSAQGFRHAGSVGGSITGLGADILIIDDPIKPQDALSEALRRKVNEFYDNTLYSRLNQKAKGAIILVMQRLHEDDLVGHVLRQEKWDVLSIPALAMEDQNYPLLDDPHKVYRVRAGDLLQPEREPQVVLDQLRRTLGSLTFSAQYQQSPLPHEGNIVKREWLRFYDEHPRPMDLVVASWDTASTEGEESDYSVGTVWGLKGETIYLLDVIRGKYQVPDLRRQIIDTDRRYRAHATLIENTDIGRAIGQELRQTGPLRPVLRKIRFDKQARMLAQSPKFEAGQVLLPRDAAWLGPYLDELLGFPNARHDDQVDSTSQALDWLSQKIAAGLPPTRPNPARPAGRPALRGRPR